MIDEDLDDRSWIDIDLNRLDREWRLQSGLHSRYAEALADRKFDLAEAENQLEVVKAEVAKNVRNDPHSFGVDKATVDAVKDAVVLSSRVQEAIHKTLELKHDVDILAACVSTIGSQRKTSLENLVQLRLADYFSEPRGPKGVERSEVDAALTPKQGRKERR